MKANTFQTITTHRPRNALGNQWEMHGENAIGVKCEEVDGESVKPEIGTTCEGCGENDHQVNLILDGFSGQ